tara:strand:- start:2223 stop:2732 length:510 start_codon:yes stop_codon:yes gene_type:complete
MKEMQQLADIVKSVFDEDVKDKIQRREIVDARMVFSKILRERGYTYASIGRFLKKDHSTIINYMRNVYSLLTQVNGLMAKYIICRDLFLIDKEVLYINKEEKDNKLSIISLNNQIEKLILERENVTRMETKYKRIEDILSIIDKKTPNGKEKFILKKVNLMFNDIADYG